ncbi:MAG: LuxR C-terminal-related transcriptional regulator [Nitrospinales bacterium]
MQKQRIHIVGAPKLGNSLLVSFLEKETGFAVDLCTMEQILDQFVHKPNPPPLLILLDYQKETSDNLQELAQVNKSSPLPLVAIFNAPANLEINTEYHQGIRGVFGESESREMLLKGIQTILDGDMWFSRKTMSKLLSQKPRSPRKKARTHNLTSREREILVHLASGSSNQEIADTLCISLHTVKAHTHNIFKKIKVFGRFQAALWAGKNL